MENNTPLPLSHLRYKSSSTSQVHRHIYRCRCRCRCVISALGNKSHNGSFTYDLNVKEKT